MFYYGFNMFITKYLSFVEESRFWIFFSPVKLNSTWLGCTSEIILVSWIILLRAFAIFISDSSNPLIIFIPRVLEISILSGIWISISEDDLISYCVLKETLYSAAYPNK